jgi:hypothetical protein
MTARWCGGQAAARGPFPEPQALARGQSEPQASRRARTGPRAARVAAGASPADVPSTPKRPARREAGTIPEALTRKSLFA